MWISKEAFTSQRGHEYKANQEISDASHFLLHAVDKVHFAKITYTNDPKPGSGLQPTTGLTGQPIDVIPEGELSKSDPIPENNNDQNLNKAD